MARFSSAVCGVLLVATVAFAGEAELDPSWGSYGVVTSDPSTGPDYAEAVVVQTDGKVLMVGGTERGHRTVPIVSRYLSGGSPDTSYGSGGSTILDFGKNAVPQSAALQADGKLVVAGGIFGVLGLPDDEVGIARLNVDGTLDSSFGTGGLVVADLTPSYDDAAGLAIQSDGKIVIGGSSHDGSGSPRLTLARFLADGTVDGTFGTGGMVMTPVGAWEILNDLAIQPDGKIVAVGSVGAGTSSAALLARFESTGTPDAGFGSGGFVQTAFTPAMTFATSLVLDGTDIIVGGNGDAEFAVARFDASGSVVTAFGTNGVTFTGLGGLIVVGGEIAHRPDGRLVQVGEVIHAFDPNPRGEIGIVTLLADGTRDSSFGDGGKRTVSLGDPLTIGWSLALQSDGKVIVGGYRGRRGLTDNQQIALRFGSATCGDGVVGAGEFCDPLGDGSCTIGCGPLQCNPCEAPEDHECAAAPPATGCKQAGSAKLKITGNDSTARNVLTWVWKKGDATSLDELGNPLDSDDYAFCAYHVSGSQVIDAEAPAGGTCKGRDCWKAAGTKGFKYTDALGSPDGLRTVHVRAGDAGMAGATVKGKGLVLGSPFERGFEGDVFPLRAQLRSKNGLCLESVFLEGRASGAGLSAQSR